MMGGGRVLVLPHAGLERWLARSQMAWTIVRVPYVDQHPPIGVAADLPDGDEIVVPAGQGHTAVVHAHNVVAIAAPPTCAGPTWQFFSPAPWNRTSTCAKHRARPRPPQHHDRTQLSGTAMTQQ